MRTFVRCLFICYSFVRSFTPSFIYLFEVLYLFDVLRSYPREFHTYLRSYVPSYLRTKVLPRYYFTQRSTNEGNSYGLLMAFVLIITLSSDGASVQLLIHVVYLSISSTS